jgi:hypothetical protein
MAKRSNAFVERLDPRRLMSSTGTVDFAGQYEIVKTGILYDVNITAGSSAGSYTGTVSSDGAAVTFSGTEPPSGVLAGQLNTSSGEVAFTATLSSKTLIVTYTATQKQVGLTQVSTTPAPVQPALESYTGSFLNYLKPADWTESQSASGIVMESRDKTEQVGAVGTVTEGANNLAAVASAEESAGATLIYGKVLGKKSTSTEVFQSGVALITFGYKHTTYASAEAVEIYTLPKEGSYDAKTKTYSGVTLTEIYEATAPKADFVDDSSTLLYMLKSITPNSTLTSTGSAPAGSKKVAFTNPGLVDPGTPGITSKSSSADGLFNSLYKSNYYDIEEGNLLNYETAEQLAAVNSQVDSFCNFLTS